MKDIREIPLQRSNNAYKILDILRAAATKPKEAGSKTDDPQFQTAQHPLHNIGRRKTNTLLSSRAKDTPGAAETPAGVPERFLQQVRLEHNASLPGDTTRRQNPTHWDRDIQKYIQNDQRHLEKVAKTQGTSVETYTSRFEQYMRHHPEQFYWRSDTLMRVRVRGGSGRGEADPTSAWTPQRATEILSHDPYAGSAFGMTWEDTSWQAQREYLQEAPSGSQISGFALEEREASTLVGSFSASDSIAESQYASSATVIPSDLFLHQAGPPSDSIPVEPAFSRPDYSREFLEGFGEHMIQTGNFKDMDPQYRTTILQAPFNAQELATTNAYIKDHTDKQTYDKLRKILQRKSVMGRDQDRQYEQTESAKRSHQHYWKTPGGKEVQKGFRQKEETKLAKNANAKTEESKEKRRAYAAQSPLIKGQSHKYATSSHGREIKKENKAMERQRNRMLATPDGRQLLQDDYEAYISGEGDIPEYIGNARTYESFMQKHQNTLYQTNEDNT